MTLRTAVALALSALVFPWISGCDRSVVATEPAAGGIAKSSTIDQALLQKVVDAPDHVAWSGRRRFESHFVAQGQPQTLVYEETVTTDGTGRFELKPEDLLVPALSSNEEALFLLSQSRRAELLFRRRDPTVRHAQLFLQNYSAFDSGGVVQLLGRDCAHWTVTGSGNSNTWQLWIDLATGVILKFEEHDPSQALVASVEYLDFDDTPDTANAVWFVSPLQEAPLDLTQAQAQLGFEPVKPKLLPLGFRLDRAERVVEPVDNRTWARFTYSDGWNEFVFMDGGPMDQPQIAQGISPNADVLRFAEVGPWMLADGRADSRRILAAVRGNSGLLKLLVESSLY